MLETLIVIKCLLSHYLVVTIGKWWKIMRESFLFVNIFSDTSKWGANTVFKTVFWTNWLHSYSQRFVRRPVAAPSASLWCSLFQTLPSPLRFGIDHDDSEYSHCKKPKFTASLKKGRVGTNQNWILMWKGNKPSPNFSWNAAGHMFTKFLLKNQIGQYFQSRKRMKMTKVQRRICDLQEVSGLLLCF